MISKKHSINATLVYVIANNSKSRRDEVRSGVPQGSILGKIDPVFPLLYLFFCAGSCQRGLRSKQQARHQAQNEIMEGLKNEEYARQLVPSDLAVMKGVIGLLEVVKEEQKNVSYKIREQEVTARLKMSECPQETLGESARPVLQGTRSHGRRRIQDQRGAR